jgi:hypothetical protein
MATLMDLIMQEYRGATPASRFANVNRMNTSVSQLMPPAVPTPAEVMSPEELAYSIANPDRPQRSTAEMTGPMRAPSFQRLMQAGAMSQSLNPARAAIGEQALAQAQQARGIRQGTESIYPFYGEPDILGTPIFSTPTASARAPTPSVSAAAAATAPVQAVIAPSAPAQAMAPLPFFAQGQTMPTQPMAIGAMGGQPMMGAFPPSFTPTATDVAPAMRQRPLPEVLASRDERTVAQKREPGFFERIFGGTQYQSNNLPVLLQPQGPMPVTGATIPESINWGDPNRAADFFAADRLLMQQNPAMFGLLGGSNG